jgi:hypothetical protein
MTVGGAQAQLKNGSWRPGRVLVAGRGPLLQVAAAGIAAVGGRVVAVADEVPASRWLRRLPTILRSPARLAQAAMLRMRLVRAGAPLLTATLARVEAVDGGLRATLTSDKREWTIDVDTVAVGDGFTPQVEVALALGAGLRRDPRDGSAIVSCDRDGRTSADGVFVAGEPTGVAGAASATATGVIAARAALGLPIPGRLRRRAAAERRFADALHAVTALPAGWTAACDDATVLCRCEGVTFGAARHAVTTLGTDDLRSLKLVTRVGMGPCQGRLCGHAATDLVAGDPAAFANRPVAVPVPLTSFLEES